MKNYYLYWTETRSNSFFFQLAVSSLPRLQIVESDLLLEALGNLHKEEYIRLNGIIDSKKQYQLTRLGPMSYTKYRGNEKKHLSRHLSVVTAYCPHVTEVTLLAFANDQCLVTLSRLQNLRSLSLLHCFKSVTFNHGILPFLQIIGQQLSTLILEVPEVDTKVVGHFCPNLVKFGLEFQNNYLCDVFEAKITEESKLFSKLLWLRVACQDISIDASSLLLLLSNCENIHYLCLSRVSNMTDEIMSEIYETNPMDNLETLCLKHCDNITADSVWPLLYRYNELKVLRLESCKNIIRRDADQIRKELLKHKDPLDFGWS